MAFCYQPAFLFSGNLFLYTKGIWEKRPVSPGAVQAPFLPRVGAPQGPFRSASHSRRPFAYFHKRSFQASPKARPHGLRGRAAVIEGRGHCGRLPANLCARRTGGRRRLAAQGPPNQRQGRGAAPALPLCAPCAPAALVVAKSVASPPLCACKRAHDAPPCFGPFAVRGCGP